MFCMMSSLRSGAFSQSWHVNLQPWYGEQTKLISCNLFLLFLIRAFPVAHSCFVSPVTGKDCTHYDQNLLLKLENRKKYTEEW